MSVADYSGFQIQTTDHGGQGYGPNVPSVICIQYGHRPVLMVGDVEGAVRSLLTHQNSPSTLGHYHSANELETLET